MKLCRCCHRPFAVQADRIVALWIQDGFTMLLVNCACGSTMGVLMHGSLDE